MEFLAVFLLAVEAIKLNNLNAFVERVIRPLLSHVNPKIKWVGDGESEKLTFIERNAVHLFFLGFYLIGIALIFLVFYKFDFNFMNWLLNAAPIYWFLSLVAALILPLFVGFLPYQFLVWSLENSIKALVWVQVKTHTGIVGILGFTLFSIQFIGRRIINS
ncbi:hypothetical protein QT15_09660 [Pseudoalteromonas flavipulchra NCIMB 2033 = ATCC BAA-314]|nr:hypothetical protein QT15_09660 [Pseudoalteromonas flavipulchra NCIMB 2033 = ATCC BAA-314]